MGVLEKVYALVIANTTINLLHLSNIIFWFEVSTDAVLALACLGMAIVSMSEQQKQNHLLSQEMWGGAIAVAGASGASHIMDLWDLLATNPPASVFLKAVPLVLGLQVGWGVLKLHWRTRAEVKQQLLYKVAELQQGLDHMRREIEECQGIRAALQWEKELALVTLQSIADAVIVTDAMGRVQSWNRAAETLTGWKFQAVRGRLLTEVFPIAQDSSNSRIPGFAQVLQGGEAVAACHQTFFKHRDGNRFSVEYSAAPIYLRGAVYGSVLVCRDVTKTRNQTRELSWQASHDDLTGCVNRREFDRRLDLAVTDAKTEGNRHCLCYLDLDRFKMVNDRAGHAAGDELLRQFTALVQANVRQSDVLGRLGGDEFALLLHNCSVEDGEMVVAKLMGAIEDFTFVWQEKTFAVGVSIGAIEIDVTTESAAQVMSAADAAMYIAKEERRHRSASFNTPSCCCQEAHLG
ncbi:MAG TPA: diguanylate cyclase [Oscillatoriaceae cyanobacterium M33_DOE_052]|uniref:Diguanylate cyclase n=1 Tax=Planktothricoides sp. SpSt-374 TaxID=2282167 RepID=A0A7C3ZWI4_9CYAN|nr:diguanylate cyclase [Oscillatoriaceae cyanobacterium M33_DOE_052]